MVGRQKLEFPQTGYCNFSLSTLSVGVFLNQQTKTESVNSRGIVTMVTDDNSTHGKETKQPSSLSFAHITQYNCSHH